MTQSRDKGGKVIMFPTPADPNVFRFELSEEDAGCFVEPSTSSWEELTDQFYEILEDSERGGLTYEDYIARCRQVIKVQPYFLDAYAHLGMVHLPPHQDDLKAAARWYRKGFKLAQELIPESFAGKIEWSTLSNRPFLRLHHGLILCALRQNKYKQAIPLMEQHLSWNPNDNIGVRFLLGDAYLASFKFKEASAHLENIAEEYPPSWYSLGLVAFLVKKFPQAVTYLRKGITENPYIAKALVGQSPVIPHAYWHGNSRQGPEEAEGYVKLFGNEIWQQSPAPCRFLDWVFTCSRGLRERAEFTEIREGLTSLHDYELRGALLDRQILMLEAITDSSSALWLEKITNRRGQERWPWESDT